MDKAALMKLLDGITSPISRIEEKLKMPKSTIQKVKDGKRTLSAEWEKVLRGFVERKEYIGLNRKKPKKEVIPTVSISSLKTKSGRKEFSNLAIPEKEVEEIAARATKKLSFREELYNKKMGIK